MGWQNSTQYAVGQTVNAAGECLAWILLAILAVPLVVFYSPLLLLYWIGGTAETCADRPPNDGPFVGCSGPGPEWLREHGLWDPPEDRSSR